MSTKRRLTSKWKQIIYYQFSKNKDKNLLGFLIEKAKACNANVRGVAFDMGNQVFLKELGIFSSINHSHPNPVNHNRKVFLFPDVPHSIKNLRNHILDDGMIYKPANGPDIKMGKEDFLKLLEVDSGDFLYCHKLTIEHIEVRGSERQRVRLATQLLSETSSKAMVHLLGPSYERKANIIAVIHKWFDAMNSRTKHDYKHVRCGFGRIL